MNVMVELISADSVRVSWDHVEINQAKDYTIQRYYVYYTFTYNGIQSEERFLTVPSSRNSLTLVNLVNEAEFQFQVAVSVDFNGETELLENDRSNVARIEIQSSNFPSEDTGTTTAGVEKPPLSTTADDGEPTEPTLKNSGTTLGGVIFSLVVFVTI